jgi:23S rRNA U2552 (ribose-2'-O)-methylase RlmE/FtsJ
MSITSDIKLKKNKFYYVVNPFEDVIENNDTDLQRYSNTFFESKNRPNIMNRAFYKMWELILMFNLVPIDQDFSSVHLAEGPGAFIQSTIYYREKFADKNKNDTFYGITLHSNDKNVPQMKSDFLKKFNNLKIYPTSNKEGLNGDLTNLQLIKNFIKYVKEDKKNIHLVTADGGFEWINENYQEQEMYQLLLGEIIAGLSVQAIGGNFIIKLFETYTEVTLKYLSILQVFYENVYIVKPLTSRSCNSEKYAVCVGFKQVKKFNEYMQILENMLEEINKCSETGNYIHDIFSDYVLSDKFINSIVLVNSDITNAQTITINNIIDYINKNNYLGELYNNYKDRQISATKYWINTYYPSNDNSIITIQDKIKEQVQNIIEENNKRNV